MGLNLIKLQVGGHNLCGLNVTNVFINRLKKISQKKFCDIQKEGKYFLFFIFALLPLLGFVLLEAV